MRIAALRSLANFGALTGAVISSAHKTLIRNEFCVKAGGMIALLNCFVPLAAEKKQSEFLKTGDLLASIRFFAVTA